MQVNELVWMRDCYSGQSYQVKVVKVTGKYVFVVRLDGLDFAGGPIKKFVKETNWEWVSPKEKRKPKWQIGHFKVKR